MASGLSRSEGISVALKHVFLLLIMQPWPYFRRGHLRLHQQSSSHSAEHLSWFLSLPRALLLRAAFLQLVLK